jgi:hypothetical protein
VSFQAFAATTLCDVGGTCGVLVAPGAARALDRLGRGTLVGACVQCGRNRGAKVASECHLQVLVKHGALLVLQLKRVQFVRVRRQAFQYYVMPQPSSGSGKLRAYADTAVRKRGGVLSGGLSAISLSAE